MPAAVNYASPVVTFPLCETLRERLYSIKAITTVKGGYAIAPERCNFSSLRDTT